MSVTQTLKKIVVVPAESYEAVLVSIDEADGDRGIYWKWSFRITSGEFEYVELVGLSSTTYSTHPSKSFTWARALGHPPDIDFDASLIENHPCRVRVILEEVTDEKGEKTGERNGIETVEAPTKSQVAAQPPDLSEVPF